jgi:hypothetical protein
MEQPVSTEVEVSEYVTVIFHCVVPEGYEEATICVVGDIEELGAWTKPLQLDRQGSIRSPIVS